MEWMTNEEYFCYKMLKYLNNNRNDKGIELSNVYSEFQLTESTKLKDNIADTLQANGFVVIDALGGVRRCKITKLGEERFNLIQSQVDKINETSIIDNKIKALTIENYKDRWKLFWRGALVSIIAALVGGLPTIIEKLQEPNQQLEIQFQGLPKYITVNDTTLVDSLRTTK